ncbi:hypothetical protein K504DRAFT_445828 [Pleomassaria siparia CBS 279.74]|uniref:Uncharacterized protein n=1 Tax=Pleomassaria siparia CBS 279.74 TaxID=1314801 RepID=A0A6G1KR78_9PLEO|nr:hypothetical protein K504DRAFT_445828 [Pleomassaria siparia CBS 279.74]
MSPSNKKPETSNAVSMCVPCTPNSCYHDLECGHRIKTLYPDQCGDNCKSGCKEWGGSSIPSKFICPDCVTFEVHVQLASLVQFGTPECSNSAHQQEYYDEKISAFAKDIIARGQAKNHRPCQRAEKLDPTLQFHSEIEGADEGYGFLSAPEPTPTRKRARSTATLSIHPSLQRAYTLGTHALGRGGPGRPPLKKGFVLPSHARDESSIDGPVDLAHQGCKVERAVRRAMQALNSGDEKFE